LPALTYLRGVRRARLVLGRRWSAWRSTSFVGGCALVVIALSPPVDHAATGDLRGHMLQHLVLGMYAPIALVLGAPVTLLLAAVPVRANRSIRAVLGTWSVRVPTRLVTATVLDVV